MSTPTATTPRGTWPRRAGLAAVAVIPLAFTGLFVAALGNSDGALDRIPAAVVNEDQLVNTTAPDGTEQPVFAGRQLVTELTGAEGFDWTITNADEAQAALDRGEVYAVLTIPEGFSDSIVSLQSSDPQRAQIDIRTDDAHAYLTGSVAQVVGETMTTTFGTAITEQVLGGLFATLGDVGSAFGDAAEGATGVAGGATGLADGARSLSSGLGQYTGGVGDLADGLWTISDQTAGLGQLSGGIRQYTEGVSQVSEQLNQAAALQPQLQPLAQGLAQVAAAGPALASGAAGLPALHDGLEDAANGAQQLADGGPALVTGVDQLASGGDQLATGAQQLADGLRTGADQIPADASAAEQTASVIADPVGVDVTTANAVTDVGQGIATFFIPLGLWLGALAVFLVLRPYSRGTLASTASNGRLVGAAFVRAGIVTGIQALLLVGLLHGALGVSWALLPATLGLALLIAAAFTAFHLLLTLAFGRGGLVVSLLLLAVQVTSTGGVYPVQLLSEPFQVLGRFLPLTYGVEGMQGIIAGGAVGDIVAAAAVLALFGLASTALALVVVRRTRRATSLGLLPATA